MVEELTHSENSRAVRWGHMAKIQFLNRFKKNIWKNMRRRIYVMENWSVLRFSFILSSNIIIRHIHI